MSGLYLPNTTKIFSFNEILGVPTDAFIMSFDIDTDSWFQQRVSFIKQDDVHARSGVRIHLSDGTWCNLEESARVICKTHRSGKYFSVNVRCLKPGMACLSFTSRQNTVYVTEIELSKPVFVNQYIHTFRQTVVVGSGIVVRGLQKSK